MHEKKNACYLQPNFSFHGLNSSQIIDIKLSESKLTIALFTLDSSGNSNLSCNFTSFSTSFLVSSLTETIGRGSIIAYGDKEDENLTSGGDWAFAGSVASPEFELHSGLRAGFFSELLSLTFWVYRCLAFLLASRALHCSSDKRPVSKNLKKNLQNYLSEKKLTLNFLLKSFIAIEMICVLL